MMPFRTMFDMREKIGSAWSFQMSIEMPGGAS